MTSRQRTDFAIMWLIFGVLVAVYVLPGSMSVCSCPDSDWDGCRITAFSILSAQYLVRTLPVTGKSVSI